jgi:AcrR family transcriptional regulator
MPTLPIFELISVNHDTPKYDTILEAAKKLFLENGYHNTSVRQIVQEANTSMGNLYFHFPNKLSILKVISKEFIEILRNQISKIHDLGFSPEMGFALDFRIGFITTLEDPKLSELWCMVQNTPEIHRFSLENKKKRLQTFFGDLIDPNELDFLAIAVQGIADGMFQQRREGNVTQNPVILSNTIIDYSLRLLGYSQEQIRSTLHEVDTYIEKEHISKDAYFNF